MIIALTLLVALVGLLLYAFCKDPKLQELGRIMFFVGLFAFLLNGEKLLTLLPKG